MDMSWVLLALLIAWSLASGTFPEFYRGLPRITYWVMALVTVAGVAVSIILHELGHALVARAFGLPVRSITLFVFGGVAEMRSEPKSPLVELAMALAGPIVSVILGLSLVIAGASFRTAPQELTGVLQYLGMLNLTLALFNMLPAFPMDGGRVARAIIWLITRDPLKATRMAARAGEVIGIMMMTFGAVAGLTTALVGGLWWFAIGWFVYSLARAELAQAEAKPYLTGARVANFMTPNPVTAPANMSVHDFVETVLARFPHDFIPIVADGRPIGAAGFREAKAASRDRWNEIAMADIAIPLAQIPVGESGEPVEALLERMRIASASRAIIVNHGVLVGILTLKDLASHLRFMAEFSPHTLRPH